MSRGTIIIAVSIAFGLFVWMADAVMDYFFFYEGTFLGLLITEVPAHEVYIRLVIMASFMIFGVLVSRVVARREQAEEERDRAIAKLQSQNAELERFAYTVSHDLKSPLFTITGFLGTLQEDIAGNRTEGAQKDIACIAGAAETMGQLLDELLDLSRVGRVANPSKEVALEDLARKAVELNAGRIARRGARVEISPDLPVVFGDGRRLLEALQNLIDNAVKFMGDQPEPRVEIGVKADDGGGKETVCYVRDNGIGIDPRYHDKVFGLFDQLDPQRDGTGIGLALVKRIIEVHGGRMWVESEGQGQGSTFCFILPRKGTLAHHGKQRADKEALADPAG